MPMMRKVVTIMIAPITRKAVNSNNDITNNEDDEDAGDGNIDEEEYLDENKIIVYDIIDCYVSTTRADLDILEIYHKILHEIFDEIDKDYITDEIHNFLTDFFNADHGKQGWYDSVKRIVINEKDSELLQGTKELLKGTLGRLCTKPLERCYDFRKALSLIHPLMKCVVDFRNGEISLQGKQVMTDGVGYLNDVSSYQIVCMEGANQRRGMKKC
ncbi:6019_t:CDS:2 [Acaulospora morrowiae]|uniref:6019_t:CDS:1 n=1 Tax=Acaulospora morrowiae TaxID=94023 RepID=A0A9N9BDA2_9GLOM|nr:6019_t:CDS:2 [Acaulospora morrowiae]